VGANPVIRGASCCLAHVPDLVRYGSKPRREIPGDPTIEKRISGSLRNYREVLSYAPNQVFIGNLAPRELAGLPRPWYSADLVSTADAPHQPSGVLGEILDQASFYAMLSAADVLEPPLVSLVSTEAELAQARLAVHPLLARIPRPRIESRDEEALRRMLAGENALPLYSGEGLVGVFTRDERAEGWDDENLAAHNLLENLSSKASGALALLALLDRMGLAAEDADYVISCGEEAVGDRYQRGGGGMAKAIGEMCGCVNASGIDVKNFCAAPASALIIAGALVQSGLYRNVIVVGGGSVAKLGMKFQACLEHDRPILEDVLASIAFLVTADDGESPVLRLEPGTVGLARIGASTSDDAVYRSLLLEPLDALGLRIPDVDRYAPELHNPEIMELAGSGDVAAKNYRAIAAMAVVAGQLSRDEMDALIARVGMPGFAPDQGHVPSGVAYIGHAAAAMREGKIQRCMILSKASLFLGRCTELFDGVSFLLEQNPARAGSRP
jgi:betaine reductase